MTRWDKIFKQRNYYKYYDLCKPYEDLRSIIDEFKQRHVRRVLDVGCGLGNNLLPLLRHGFDAYGLDSSQEAVTLTKELLAKEGEKIERVITASFSAIPFSNSWFDAVLSIQTLQHGRETEVRRGICEIARVLKPAGMLFVTVPGRYTQGRQRYCLITTARRIEERTFVPTQGKEIGIPHHIFNKSILLRYFSDFTPIRIWKDSKDYYCFLGEKK